MFVLFPGVLPCLSLHVFLSILPCLSYFTCRIGIHKRTATTRCGPALLPHQLPMSGGEFSGERKRERTKKRKEGGGGGERGKNARGVSDDDTPDRADDSEDVRVLVFSGVSMPTQSPLPRWGPGGCLRYLDSFSRLLPFTIS